MIKNKRSKITFSFVPEVIKFQNLNRRNVLLCLRRGLLQPNRPPGDRLSTRFFQTQVLTLARIWASTSCQLGHYWFPCLEPSMPFFCTYTSLPLDGMARNDLLSTSICKITQLDQVWINFFLLPYNRGDLRNPLVWARIEPGSTCFTSDRSNHYTMPPCAALTISAQWKKAPLLTVTAQSQKVPGSRLGPWLTDET